MIPIPLYQQSRDEISWFEEALEAGLPVMLTGPTGCGKTRLVEHVAARSGRELTVVVGNEDTTSADLLGRFLVRGGDVEWTDGPVTTAVRKGSLCYLDEVVEMRRESLAVLHPLADHRRTLHLDRRDEVVDAAPGFGLVCSYNPGRSVGYRELRAAFRQRFVTIALDYLLPEQEVEVVCSESGLDEPRAGRLVRQAGALRCAVAQGGEAPSTRMLVNAAQLLVRGIDEHAAVEICLLGPLSGRSDNQGTDALRKLIAVG